MMRSKPSLLVAPFLLLTLLLVPATPQGDPGDEDLRYQRDRVMERVLRYLFC